MADITKLRYICSKKPQKLVEYTNRMIPYKVEIKGNPTYVNKKWFLWFNLPDGLEKELPFGDLDKGRF